MAPKRNEDGSSCPCPVLAPRYPCCVPALRTLLLKNHPLLSQVPCPWRRTFSWGRRLSSIWRHRILLTSVPPQHLQRDAAFFTSCPNCRAVLLWSVKQLPPSTPDLDAIQGQVKIFLSSQKLSVEEELSGRNMLRKCAASLGPIHWF